MQWNITNMTKEEIKKKQEEYIKVAIEMSKKAKSENDIPIAEPVIINIPTNKPPAEEIEEVIEETETVSKDIVEINGSAETVDVSSDEETSQERLQASEDVTENIAQSEETDIYTNVNENSESDDNTQSAEEIFANVFITEEEAEEKLREAEKIIEAFSEDIPDFNKYIESHNKETSESNAPKTADE